jgi:putative multiple sugar transport system permease protein
MGWSPLLTTILALVAGVVVGIWQGFWIAYFRIPSFIVTLSGMLVFKGLGNLILDGLNREVPDFFKTLSNGQVPDVIGGADAPIHITTVVIGLVLSLVYIAVEAASRKKRAANGFELMPFGFFAAKLAGIAVVINLLTIWLARHKGLPNVLILLTILILIYTFITQRTVIGRHVYALGGNEKAAKLSGVKTNKILFLVYANMGLMAAISAIVVSGRLATASQQAGQGFELDAIASCFIGGASASGGVGTVMGAIIGGFIMGVLNNGMSIAGWGSFQQQVVKGLVLLGAVIFDVVSKSKSK